MNILVLGADGFLGSHFIDHIIKFDHTITAFDRFPSNTSHNIQDHWHKLKVIAGDFNNKDALEYAVQGQDIIFDFIWCTTPAESWNNPSIEIELNLKPSITLLELAVLHGVKKIVFPSSGGTVYGSKEGLLNEDSHTLPYSPYGISKLATEHFLHYYRVHSGISADIYRIGNAYGPRQQLHGSQGVISKWLYNISLGEEIQVFGDQVTTRDYVYVTDIAYLMAFSLNDLQHSDTYNLGSGKSTSIMDLFEIVKSVVNIPIRYKVFPRRLLDNKHVVLDSNKLLKYFSGFTFINLHDGVKATWDYITQIKR